MYHNSQHQPCTFSCRTLTVGIQVGRASFFYYPRTLCTISPSRLYIFYTYLICRCTDVGKTLSTSPEVCCDMAVSSLSLSLSLSHHTFRLFKSGLVVFTSHFLWLIYFGLILTLFFFFSCQLFLVFFHFWFCSCIDSLSEVGYILSELFWQLHQRSPSVVVVLWGDQSLGCV